jgi:hypothetical protein
MLHIEIIGAEDAKQKDLIKRVRFALNDLSVDATIVQVTNWEDIIAYGIIKAPAIVIRKQVISQGILPDISDLSSVLSAFLPNSKISA